MRRRPATRASTAAGSAAPRSGTPPTAGDRRALLAASRSAVLGAAALLAVVLAVTVAPAAMAQTSIAGAGVGPDVRAQQTPTTTEPGTAEPLTPETTERQSTTTSSTTSSTAPATTVVDPSGPEGPAESPLLPVPVEEIEGPTTTLPSGPPPGFTEEQFRTFISVVEACGPDPGAVCERLYEWTGNRTLAEATQWFVSVPVAAALVVLLALIANWLVRRSIDRYVRRLEERTAAEHAGDPAYSERKALRLTTASSTIASAASVAIFTVAVFLVLAQFDISLGPLLAGAGIAGVALGFGAQNIVRDVLAGVFVIVEDQYGIGDVIDAGRATGTVEGISLRMTRIRDIEGTLWFVPNGTISEVGNMTQRWARVILDVEVAYGVDHHLATRLIKQAADDMWKDPDSAAHLIEEPELWGVEMLGESSVSIRIAVKSAPADQWAAARELRSRIKDTFDAAGIEMPFPQRSIWLRQEPAAVPEPDRAGVVVDGTHPDREH